MTGSTFTRCHARRPQSRVRLAIVTVASLVLVSLVTDLQASDHSPHWISYDSSVFHSDGCTVVKAIAASGHPDSGNAEGGASFRFFEEGVADLCIFAQFDKSEFTFDSLGNVLEVAYSGLAEVAAIGIPGKPIEAKILMIITDGNPSVSLMGDSFELEFPIGPMSGQIAVQTNSPLESARTTVKFDFTLSSPRVAGAALRTQSGKVFGRTYLELVDGRRSAVAVGEVTKFKTTVHDRGVETEYKGCGFIETDTGQCESKFKLSFFDSFRREDSIKFKAPRCGWSAIATGDLLMSSASQNGKLVQHYD